MTFKESNTMKRFSGIGRNTSIFAIPWMVSLVMTYILFKGIRMTAPRYGTRVCLFAVLVLLIWTSLFIWHQRKVARGATALYIKCRLVSMLFFGCVLGTFLAYTVWGSGYLSLLPYERIDNGLQHIDSLFLSSIAESWKRSMYPSTLLNDERYLAYHTFSQMLMGMLAGIMGVPAFITYNYQYPVLFLPIYCFSVFLSVASAKAFFEGKPSIQFLDIIVIGLFFFGITDNIESYGVWKNSFVVSESFLIANTELLLSYAFAFFVLRKWSKNRRVMDVFCVAVIPAEIFIISWSKISVGFIFTAGIMYFIFRMKLKDFKFWLLDALYLVDFLICLRLFNAFGGDMSGAVASKFRWLAFEDYCPGRLGIWGHYFVLSLMTMLFIGLELHKNRYNWKDVKFGKTVWIENMIFMSILAFLPGAVMVIGGGSAAYFSYVIEVPALVLLCGHNYIDIEKDAKGAAKPLLYATCFSWCIWMGYHHKPTNPLSLITNEHASDLSSMLLDIREVVGKDAEKYTIYLDADSVLSHVFPAGRTAIYVCPAMTGVGVINATYAQDGAYYAYTGESVEAYGVHEVDNGYLSYEAALSTAKERGKDKMIHITNTGYKIIDL